MTSLSPAVVKRDALGPSVGALREFATFDRLLAALLFLLIIAACGLTPMQTDSWWQLRAGRDMWASRSILLTDIYSHTASGVFWLNHEWLAEVIYYAMYRLGGLPLVTLFAAALICGGWAFTWVLSKGSASGAFVWTALALVSSSVWWEPRPHAFSLLFLTATVFALARQRYLWLPLIFLVWANCHGGVLLGFLILGAGLTVQTLWAPATWRRAVLILAGCMLAASVTPLGLAFWTEIPRSLARIRLYPLDEWKRPGLTEGLMLPFWIMAVAFGAGLIRNRDRLWRATSADATICACAIALLPMALTAVRNVGPFLMIAVPALTILFPRQAVKRLNERPLLNGAIVLAAALGVAGTLVSAYRHQLPRLRWAPVTAGALAALERCPDNLYNRYDEGGPLLWFAPERKVFLDGRQDPYAPELVLEHIRMETGSGDYQAVFARHAIHCAYLPTTSPVAVRLSAAGWQSLYRDATWVVLRD